MRQDASIPLSLAKQGFDLHSVLPLRTLTQAGSLTDLSTFRVN